MVHLITRKRM